jgi:hypothetical protein
MGLDLTVGIIKSAIGNGGGVSDWWLANERLRMKRDYQLFAQIAGLRGDARQVMTPKPVPESKRVDWYDDEGIKRITEDPYGSPLTYVTPDDFKKVKFNNVREENVPYVRMLAELPDDTAILLHWS